MDVALMFQDLLCFSSVFSCESIVSFPNWVCENRNDYWVCYETGEEFVQDHA